MFDFIIATIIGIVVNIKLSPYMGILNEYCLIKGFSEERINQCKIMFQGGVMLLVGMLVYVFINIFKHIFRRSRN
ncbi:MAG: hypothetical protein R3Y47_12270 [Lachnospiraceae bacterium]